MKKSTGNLVLIAEDSPTQAEHLKHILTKNGYEVSHSRDGKEAFDLIKKEKPLLVISDIVMPETDGYELCRKIKTDDRLKGIPVILLTVLSDPADVIKSLECGADSFITKPYNEKHLLSRIQDILINTKPKKDRLTEKDIEIVHTDKRYSITADPRKILDFLLSTYENSMQKNKELIYANKELKSARYELRALNKKLEDLVEERTSRLKHINSVLESIRNINQSIVREKNANTLVKKICSALIRARCYNSTWILLFNEDMQLTTFAGEGYHEEFTHFITEIKKNKLPYCCQQGLLQPGIVLTESQMTECTGCPMFKKESNHISLTIRLEYEGILFGILTIKLSPDLKIDEEEYDLLNEIASDISFALNSIKLVEEHEKAIGESEKKYRNIFNNVTDLYYEASYDGTILDVSPSINILSKGLYRREDLIGRSIHGFYSNPERRQPLLEIL